MRRCLRFSAGVAMLLAGAVAQAREPTALEQYFLEVVNRARADPQAEVLRLSDEPGEIWGDDGVPVPADLNEGLPPGTISAAPKPPLAFDARLIDAASDYADLLLATEQFQHDANGTTPASRMMAAGYPFSGDYSMGENLGITAYSIPLPLVEARVDQHHFGLFVDGNVPGRGHRILLMKEDFREIGIGIRLDSNAESFFEPGYHDIVSVQNFAYSAGRIFVTGVIYDDSNENGFYDPGESSGALALEVRTPGGAKVASGSSFGSGGYSINLAGVAPGAYRLVVHGAAEGLVEIRDFWWGGTQNVKVDLVNPAFLSSPVFGNPYRPDLRIGRSATSLTGNDVHSNSAKRQLVKLTARTARPRVWHAVLENDGYHDDTVRISAPRGNRRFVIRYFRRNGAGFANATASMVAGADVVLGSGAGTAYRVSVKPGRTALGRRVGASFHIRAVSRGEASKVDRVNGTLVNRTKSPRRARR